MTRIAIRSDQTGPTVQWSVPVSGWRIRVAIPVTKRGDKKSRIQEWAIPGELRNRRDLGLGLRWIYVSESASSRLQLVNYFCREVVGVFLMTIMLN